ncbi:cytochrome P460 family protein [Fontimonas sp. SYSU GA230001]|uniref:cytochrome P460 family protein n=1 Tax=Fontimonas sp. SYSU GA230001 TaxID=3142450 RepID=UPI0032B43E82
MRTIFAVLGLAFGLSALASDAAPAAFPEVPYPSGYRDWRHVKTMLIEDGHPLYASFGGIHHLYANPKAMKGYAGGRFPDGAVIVFDLLDAQAGGNAITEGARKIVGVMHKDSKKYAATGGWGFEGFAGGDPQKRAVGAAAASACFDCHAAQKAHDYVFSTPRGGE